MEVVASLAALRGGIPGVLIDEGRREEAVVVSCKVDEST